MVVLHMAASRSMPSAWAWPSKHKASCHRSLLEQAMSADLCGAASAAGTAPATRARFKMPMASRHRPCRPKAEIIIAHSRLSVGDPKDAIDPKISRAGARRSRRPSSKPSRWPRAPGSVFWSSSPRLAGTAPATPLRPRDPAVAPEPPKAPEALGASAASVSCVFAADAAADAAASDTAAAGRAPADRAVAEVNPAGGGDAAAAPTAGPPFSCPDTMRARPVSIRAGGPPLLSMFAPSALPANALAKFANKCCTERGNDQRSLPMVETLAAVVRAGRRALNSAESKPTARNASANEG
mmetsp:Transcript_63055/g.180775  ORF Transcript_63055/g.180775 Transcript_63055/m.180775 type:complete len:297 (-) Transcript_63055:123-1013(-)